MKSVAVGSPGPTVAQRAAIPAAKPPTEQPLISVVTPSFNQGAFVERCVQSVLDQEYANIEHIVCDNCSTDQTLDILRRYTHLDCRSEPDRGQSDALNKGFRRARGEIIAWINADDSYEPGVFALAARELHRDTGVMAIAGRVEVIDADGNRLETLVPRFSGVDGLVQFWSGGYGLCQPGVLFRREVLQQVGELRPDLHYAMDYDFWLRLAQHYPVKIVDQTLARYIVHPDSKSGSAYFGRGFNEEQAQVSRPYWGPPWRWRYWRMRRGCRRFLADQLVNAIVSSHKRQNRLDWSSLGRLALRHPLALGRRYMLAVFAERLIGAARWSALRRRGGR
ncbi:MAG: glycosyltransferase [Planctomycetes bacterium]|nr:glycosyltransferase [Planctomycetota bacterium]